MWQESCGCDIVMLCLSVVVNALSRGTDSISCRDIRYKGEDTSAYRYIERSSGSCDQAAGDAGSTAMAANSMLPATVETEVAGEVAGRQPRPITKLLPDLPQPINSQQPEFTRPITLQQTGLPAGCRPQPIATQQLGPSQPISMQQPTSSQPITTQSSELSQRMMSHEQQMPTNGQPELVAVMQPLISQAEQPLTVAQMETSRPVSIQQPSFLQPVTVQPPELSQPVVSQQQQVLVNGQRQPVTTKQPVNSEPVAVPHTYPPVGIQQPSLPQPITTERPTVSQPVMSQQPWTSHPITVKQLVLSEPVASQQSITLSQMETSRPITMQQPTLSQPVTLPQVPPAVCSLPMSTSNQQSVSGGYQPSAPALNPPLSVPMGSHLPTTSPPVTTSPVTYVTPPRIQDLVSRPPPPLEFCESQSPPRVPQPQIWSAMAPPPAGSSMQYWPRPVASLSASQIPGILRRPLSPDVRSFLPSQEYAQAMNLYPGQTGKVGQNFGEGGGDRPHSNPYKHSEQFHTGYPPTDRRAASLPPTVSASSRALGCDQRDFGNTESFSYGAQTYDGRGGETYGYGAAYSSPYNLQYYPALQPMWRPGQPPTAEFQSPAEFPASEPIPLWSPGYVYAHSGEGQPVMYRMPLESPPLDYHGTAVDYDFPMSSSLEIPTSVIPSSEYPPSTVPQDDVITQGSNFSGDQSSLSSNVASATHWQSYADKVRSAPTVQQTDGDVPYSSAKRSDAMLQSCEHDKTVEYKTIAGTFSPGNFALVTFICFFLIVHRRGGVEMLLSQVNVIHENHFLLFLMSLFLCCLSGYVIIVKKKYKKVVVP